MAPLLDSLKELGCEITFENKEGYFPFTIKGQGFQKHKIKINIDRSSQFLSALLIASCLDEEEFVIELEGSHGMAYIDMTCQMMQQFGVTAHKTDDHTYFTPKGQHYRSLDYQIEPDVSAACYFYAMCPLLHIPVRVSHVHFDSLQGEVEFIRILEKMGCTAKDEPEGSFCFHPRKRVFQASQ